MPPTVGGAAFTAFPPFLGTVNTVYVTEWSTLPWSAGLTEAAAMDEGAADIQRHGETPWETRRDMARFRDRNAVVRVSARDKKTLRRVLGGWFEKHFVAGMAEALEGADEPALHSLWVSVTMNGTAYALGRTRDEAQARGIAACYRFAAESEDEETRRPEFYLDDLAPEPIELRHSDPAVLFQMLNPGGVRSREWVREQCAEIGLASVAAPATPEPEPALQDAFTARVEVSERRAHAYDLLRQLPPEVLEQAIEHLERLGGDDPEITLAGDLDVDDGDMVGA